MVISGVASLVVCCCMACDDTSRETTSSQHDNCLNYFAGVYLCFGIVWDIFGLCVAISVFVDTVYSGSPHPALGRAYPEYRFDHFRPALRRKVSDTYKWGTIITCLTPSDACLALNKAYPTSHQLFNAPLNPLQSGCCMPPAECEFNFASPTNWTSPTNNYTSVDCAVWSNDITKLCYSCNSCKAGSLAKIRKNLIKTNIVLFVMAVVSFILHVFSCFLLLAKDVNRS
ncbi:unnamed protein product [Cuscuta campestris]|uniref:Tetraspanin n=1 Tax=Cuscuta campestris TaxID=132261 RepID=A0A484L1U3_9ASTE|nr:unnamed protein product [Cuscuta campestris]